MADVSQEAREAAANAVRCGYPGGGNGNKVVADAIKGGLADSYSIVQAFARFEHDILTRTSQPNIATVYAYEAGFEDGQREAGQPK